MSHSTHFPKTLHYTQQDEWADRSGSQITVGITDYAQEQLGDVVYIELPEIGQPVEAGKPFGVIESVKAVSDLSSPVSGQIVGTNTNLADQPELINQDCYGEGWMIRIEMSEIDQWDALLDAQAYRQSVDNRDETQQ